MTKEVLCAVVQTMRKKIKRHGVFYVYIVQCKNGTYYTGYTSHLENRIKAHNTKQGAKYLRGKGPVTLVYAKAYKYYKHALNEERRIKKMRRGEKELLIRKYRDGR